MKIKTPPKPNVEKMIIKAKIINAFLYQKDNTIKGIAARLNLTESFVNSNITSYLKQKKVI